MLEDRQRCKTRPYQRVKIVSRKEGRPRAGERECLREILRVLYARAHWRDLTDRSPQATPCWIRLVECKEEETGSSLHDRNAGRVTQITPPAHPVRSLNHLSESSNVDNAFPPPRPTAGRNSSTSLASPSISPCAPSEIGNEG